MVLVTALTAALIFACCPVTWGQTHQSQVIHHLSPETFDQTIYNNSSDTNRWLVLFHDPNSERSKAVEHALEEAAQQLSDEVSIGIIDCEAHKEEDNFCYDQKQVRLLSPYVQYIHRKKDIWKVEDDAEGDKTNLFARFARKVAKAAVQCIYRIKSPWNGEDFTEGHNADSFLGFARKVAGKALVPVSNFQSVQDNLLGTSSLNGVSFIAFDPMAKGTNVDEVVQSSRILRAFARAAEQNQPLAPAFGVVMPGMSQKDLERLGFGDGTSEGAAPYIVRIEKELQDEGGVSHKPYRGWHNARSMSRFIHNNELGAITNLERMNFDHVSYRGKPLAIMFYRKGMASSARAIERLQQYIHSGPSNVTDKFIFCTMDGDKWHEYRGRVGVQSKDLPELVVYDVKVDTFWSDRKSHRQVTPNYVPTFLEEVPSKKSMQEKLDYIPTLLEKVAAGELEPTIDNRFYFQRYVRENPEQFAIMVVCLLLMFYGIFIWPLNEDWLYVMEHMWTEMIMEGQEEPEDNGARRGKKKKLIVDADKKNK